MPEHKRQSDDVEVFGHALDENTAGHSKDDDLVDDILTDQVMSDLDNGERQDLDLDTMIPDVDETVLDVDSFELEDDEAVDPMLLELGRILAPEDMDNLRSLENFIKQQQILVDQKLSEVEQIGEQARKDGYEQGSREAAELMATIAHTNQQEQTRVFDQLVDVIMTAMRILVDRYDQAELIAETVNKVLHEPGRKKLGQNAQELTLMVHPSLHDEVHQHLAGLLGSDELENLLEIKGDPQLPRERSLLISQVGTVELGVEQQLQALRNGLLGASVPSVSNVARKEPVDASDHPNSDV